jgi:hypothetical protein
MLAGAYTVSDEHGQARITVMSLPGEGGGALNNVNRWRLQVGLPEIDSLADQPISRLRVDGRPAALINLTGTPEDAEQPLRTLVTLVAMADETWFIKMTGPEATVQNQAPAFQNLLASFHFH